MNQHEEWLAQRRTGLGGSDIPNIMGLGFGNPYDTFLDKIGVKETEQNEAMEWGNRNEQAVADKYQEMHPEVKLEDTGLKIFRHPDHEWMLATPDRIVIPLDGSKQYGLEIKTTSAWMGKKWGEADTDDVPDMYIIQVQWYMDVKGFDRWDLAVLIGGNEYREYIITHNTKLSNVLFKKAQEFWEIYVLQESPPPMDGSEDAKNFLKSWFPKHNENLLPMTHEMLLLLRERSQMNELAESYIEKKVEAEVKIMEAIGENLGFEGDGAKVTFKKTKDSTKTNWKGLALDLMDFLLGEDQAEKLGEYTKDKPGSRKLYVTYKVENE